MPGVVIELKSVENLISYGAFELKRVSVSDFEYTLKLLLALDSVVAPVPPRLTGKVPEVISFAE